MIVDSGMGIKIATRKGHESTEGPHGTLGKPLEKDPGT